MKTLLFGANGYIGNSIYADIRVGREDLELTDYRSVVEFLKKFKPTHIVSAAAKHGSFREMQHEHHTYLRTNFIIDSNILEASSNLGIENVYIFSSISGLPESEHETSESELSSGPVSESNFGYNFSKYASTQLVHSYQLDGFTNYRSLLLGNIYGYNDRFDRNTNVVATLIKKFFEAKNKDIDVELYGNGLDSRCLTHLSDVTNIVSKVLVDPPSSPEPMIISDSTPHTVEQVAHEIKKHMNFEKEVIFQGKSDDRYSIKIINNYKLMDYLGAYEFLDLDRGIERSVKEFMASKTNE